MTDTSLPVSKQCAYCQQHKPLTEFRRRTGKRSKGQSRRGACRECRKIRGKADVSGLPPVPGAVFSAPVKPAASASAGKNGQAAHTAAPSARQAAVAVLADQGAAQHTVSAARQTIKTVPARGDAPHEPKTAQPKPHSRPVRSRDSKSSASSAGERAKPRPRPVEQRRKPPLGGWPKPEPDDYSALVPSAKGMILMRGHSDKGRRWHQEIDLELAVTLVREHAAVVVNRRTIRRLYSNKDFRKLILTRDNYTCHFCGLYGDTIDHLLPRAKGGHTTPDNCVCACNLCNQTKADMDVEEFMRR
ncbi:HNH endonuclease [Paenibacillus sp. DMB5]|uniref:HNH endonuclease signature motif containing protein n=1 Tax=Paenibacillus sp. DMB5 TaxID=1780103 RepID=UPI000A8EA6E3|nr:HNH endonuclease [Paenibacillus sp. DMB5]